MTQSSPNYMRILSVVFESKSSQCLGTNYMKKQRHSSELISKNMYRSERDSNIRTLVDFEDLYLLILQGHLNIFLPMTKALTTAASNHWTRYLLSDKRRRLSVGIEVIDAMILRFNEIHKFSDWYLYTQIDEGKKRTFVRCKESMFDIQEMANFKDMTCILKSRGALLVDWSYKDGLRLGNAPTDPTERRDLPANPIVSVRSSLSMITKGVMNQDTRATKDYNKAFGTLISNVMIKKSVSMVEVTTSHEADMFPCPAWCAQFNLDAILTSGTLDIKYKSDFDVLRTSKECHCYFMQSADVHPDETCIAASSSVPWIYMAQFWHTLKEDGSKYRLRFMLDKKELTLILDDFRQFLSSSTSNCEQSLCRVTLGRDLLFASSSNIFDSVSKIYKDYCQSLHDIRDPISSHLALVQRLIKEDEMIFQIHYKLVLLSINAVRSRISSENIGTDVEHGNLKKLNNTKIEPRSDKESPEVEIAKEKEVLQGRYGYLFTHLRARFMPRKSFGTLADNLHDVMVESLPEIVDKHIKKQVMQQVPEQVRNQVPMYVVEGLILERKKAKEETERLIAKDILQERGNIQAQISTQIENAIANVIPSQVDASVRNYISGHILHVHPAQSQTSYVPEQQYQLYLAMKADPQL
ncbi:hypothetical protein Tco_0262478 [Tanacetum coccineum]